MDRRAVLAQKDLEYIGYMSNREVIDLALACFANPAKRSHYFDLYSNEIVLHGYPGVTLDWTA